MKLLILISVLLSAQLSYAGPRVDVQDVQDIECDGFAYNPKLRYDSETGTLEFSNGRKTEIFELIDVRPSESYGSSSYIKFGKLTFRNVETGESGYHLITTREIEPGAARYPNTMWGKTRVVGSVFSGLGAFSGKTALLCRIEIN